MALFPSHKGNQRQHLEDGVLRPPESLPPIRPWQHHPEATSERTFSVTMRNGMQASHLYYTLGTPASRPWEMGGGGTFVSLPGQLPGT